VVADAARLGDLFEIVGLLDDLRPERRGDVYAGFPVLGGAEQLASLKASGVEVVLLGVGDCAARLRLADESQALGFELGTVVHPAAVVASDVELGAGSFVAAGAVINPAARIGRAAIVNTNAVVEHHCELADGVHVSPGALLAGAVKVGRLSWIGIGAVVIEKIRIGAACTIGAGGVVVRDVADATLAFGVPARPR
jgi:sugar O-acyltransferase (sialic acid O-acetyltransferase NeuD family)